MIPLSTFDFRRVLDGARVPLRWPVANSDLVHDPIARRMLEDARTARIEWCGDIGWREEGPGYPRQWFATPAPTMALDPTHPDVARLIDRRIAEARGWPGVWMAALDCTAGSWRLIVVSSAPTGSRHDATFHAIVKDIEPIPANYPAARAALLCALYPKEGR